MPQLAPASTRLTIAKTYRDMTKLTYMDNTYLFEIETTLLGVCEDPQGGSYAVVADTIHYPQGGGQPSDTGRITAGDRLALISDVRMVKGVVRHYGNVEALKPAVGGTVRMRVDRQRRLKHAAYHTAGHLIAGVLTEDLGLELIPAKAHQFPDAPYVAFQEAGLGVDWDDITHDINMALLMTRLADHPISTETVAEDSDKFKAALLPENFRFPKDKPLRLVTIDSYRPIPCGGTHVSSLGKLGRVAVTKVARKNGQLRFRYTIL